mgnify:CR=1 FL=1
MFIVNLTYIKPLDEVEKFLEKHIDFLNHYYTKGHFNRIWKKKSKNCKLPKDTWSQRF